jgi:hypothetical protein
MGMADLAKELEELHATVVRTIRERVENGSEDDDGNFKPTSNDDLRIALQLLKQNAVTANLAEADSSKLKGRMAGKLNFSALQEKVMPIRPEIQLPDAARRHNSGEAQQA